MTIFHSFHLLPENYKKLMKKVICKFWIVFVSLPLIVRGQESAIFNQIQTNDVRAGVKVFILLTTGKQLHGTYSGVESISDSTYYKNEISDNPFLPAIRDTLIIETIGSKNNFIGEFYGISYDGTLVVRFLDRNKQNKIYLRSIRNVKTIREKPVSIEIIKSLISERTFPVKWTISIKDEKNETIEIPFDQISKIQPLFKHNTKTEVFLSIGYGSFSGEINMRGWGPSRDIKINKMNTKAIIIGSYYSHKVLTGIEGEIGDNSEVRYIIPSLILGFKLFRLPVFIFGKAGYGFSFNFNKYNTGTDIKTLLISNLGGGLKIPITQKISLRADVNIKNYSGHVPARRTLWTGSRIPPEDYLGKSLDISIGLLFVL